MVTVVGIYTRPLINEKDRSDIPDGVDVSKLSQSEQNNMFQNRISVEEFDAYSKPIIIDDEHDRRNDIGYAKSMWRDKDNIPHIELKIVDEDIARKVKSGYYKGLSLDSERDIIDRKVRGVDIKRIALVKKPFFENCKIKYWASKNISKKNIYSQNKSNQNQKKTLLFTIASYKMEQKQENKSADNQPSQNESKMEIDMKQFQELQKQLNIYKKKEKKELEEYKKQGLQEYENDWKGINREDFFFDDTVDKVIKGSYTRKEARSMKKHYKSILDGLRKRKRDVFESKKKDENLRNERQLKKVKLPIPNSFSKPKNGIFEISRTISQKASYMTKEKDDLLFTLMGQTPLEKLIK